MVLLAIVAVGAFAAGETIEAFLTRRAAGVNSLNRRVLLLWSVLGLTVLATMAQPSGYHIFLLGRNFTADPLLQQEILEMLPPPFFMQPDRAGGLAFVPGFAGFWIAAGMLAPLLLWNRGRLPFVADYLLAGFFVYQAAMHWRLLPLFAIGAAAAYGALTCGLAKRLSMQARLGLAWAALIVSIFLPLSFIFFVDENGTFFQRNVALVRGDVMSLDDYPEPLLDFIVGCELPDRMFSESNYCGYYMWRLSPERHKLFTDNRFDLFGSRFRFEEKIILAAGNPGDRFGRDGKPFERGWKDLLDQYGVNFIAVHRDARPRIGNELPLALIRSGKWKDVYYYMPPTATSRNLDPNAGISVWVRDEPRFADIHQRALDYFKRENPLSPLPEELDRMLLGNSNKLDTTTSTSQSANPNWRVPIGK